MISPPPTAHIRPLAALLVVLALLSSALVGCGPEGGHAGTTSVVVAPSPAATPSPALDAPPEAELGVVLDGSSSVPIEIVAAFRERIAAEVAAWPGAPPPDYRAGAEPKQGLQFVERGVDTRSLSWQASAIDEHIPSVPGVPRRPDVTDPEFLTKDRAWAALAAATTAALTEARAKAAALAERIRKAPLPDGWSDILDATTAVEQTLIPGHRRLLVVSDLDNNRPGALLGDFGDTTVGIAHVCDDMRVCTRQEAAWAQDLSAHHAYRVAFARPEFVLDQLHAFTRGEWPK